jgi:hypothetical protein
MRYVIIRDDDTNAFTPVECLERLYRPFLDRGLPVNLAIIPEVSTRATMADGRTEGFLVKRRESDGPTLPLAANRELVDYLHGNQGYRVLQHGCHHDYLEFECPSQAEVIRRLQHGTQRLLEAGFPPPQTFVAPYDKLSRASLLAVSERFRVLSTGWYELRRLPYSWWPSYAVKKWRGTPHWQVGRTLLLSHPGCLLSYQRSFSTALQGIVHCLERSVVTVLVTHWWEYFRTGEPDEPFIDFLHETLRHLARRPDVKIVSFDDLISGGIALN